MALDFRLPASAEALAAEATELAREATADRWCHEDAWIAQPDRAFASVLAERGWIGMTWPAHAGGGGRSALERFAVYEALITEGAPIASAWFADRQMGPSLLQFGNDEQRARWLPGMRNATAMWCIGMSEPDAGSDVASIRTRATRDGDAWVLDGRKIWTSGAAVADWCYLIARTDPDAPKHRGLSEFVVDMRTPGVEVTPIRDTTGDRHFCEITFDDVRVPADHLVGVEGNSFRQVMRQMEHERGGIDRLVSNRRLFRDCHALVERADRPLRLEAVRIEERFRIGRLLVLRETVGQSPAGYSALTKTYCTELEVDVASFCGRALGPAAMIIDTGLGGRVARNLCYAPGYTIMGGTTQILRNILGERLLGLPR